MSAARLGGRRGCSRLIAVAAAQARGSRPRAERAAVGSSRRGDARGECRPLDAALSRLPEDVHVQAHKPRDPSLIPTVLTLEAPPGVTVDAINYPPPAS